jgi:hypothetical protein
VHVSYLQNIRIWRPKETDAIHLRCEQSRAMFVLPQTPMKQDGVVLGSCNGFGERFCCLLIECVYLCVMCSPHVCCLNITIPTATVNCTVRTVEVRFSGPQPSRNLHYTPSFIPMRYVGVLGDNTRCTVNLKT